MNSRLDSMMEEINDNMITGKPDKFIYRTKLFEILHKYSGVKVNLK